MSVAFEYGGIDREPVCWAEQRQSTPSGADESVEKPIPSDGEQGSPSDLDIDMMIITQ